MSPFRLTRCFAGSTRILPGRLSTEPRKRTKPQRNRTECIWSSSSTVEGAKQRAAEAALLTFYHCLNTTMASTRPQALTALHAAAGNAMQQCLRCGSPGEALAVYHALCSCGVLEPVALPAHAKKAAHHVGLEKIALEALRRMPHRVREVGVVSQLVVAEAGERLIEEDPPSPPPGLSSRSTSAPVATAATFAFDIVKGQKITAAERFRIDLHRGIQLLCTSKYSQLQIGRNFLLKKLHDITVSARLRAEVEVLPMCLLSGGVLWHPFAYATPTLPWAQRLRHFDDLGLSAASIKTLSEAQVEGLEEVWASTDSLRPLCSSALRFLAALATEWDQIFLRRVAEMLILPDHSHNVFPSSYNRSQPLSSAPAQDSSVGAVKVDAEDKQRLSSRTKWTDPAHGLFPSMAGGSSEDALLRAELVVKRRLHHGVVIPDAPYILLYFHQLQQMGRHREIVLTHGVLLDLLHIALHHRDPRRFNANRALHAFMLSTTTDLTRRNFPRSKHTYTMPSCQMQDGGVTVLGLQDELALLDVCPERTYVGESELGGEALSGLAYSQALQRAGHQTHNLGHLSAVLAAKQLERVIKTHRKGLSFVAVMGSASKTQAMDISQLVDDIVDSSLLQTSEVEDSPERERPRLFKNRPRSYWSHNSVMVATTSSNTRSLAFALGVSTFPPISAS